MNWFIYIGGGMVGFLLVASVPLKGDQNFATAYKLILWVTTWVWICWKFIN